VRSRAPTGKNHDATTPVLTNLWESDHTLTQRLGGYCRYQQYGGTHSYRQNTNITETAMKDSPPRPSITRPARRGASTAPRLRLVRGPLDGAPRPHPGSDSYEARSTGRLDRAPAPTRTRPARRGASTAPRLRLVRGPLDGAPRPRPGSSTRFLYLPQDESHSIQCGYLLPPTGMAAAWTNVGTIPTSSLTVLPPIP
jgi:hypothetical protein